jgi:magnesium-transporting ATPase (P-type)
LIRIYVKGAPEMILDKCTRTFDVDAKQVNMSHDQLGYIQTDILSKKFTTQGYRALAFAFKDMTVNEFEGLKQRTNNFAEEDGREYLENQLTFVALIAMKDDLRNKVLGSVHYARRAGITVRLVSGDHLETAVATAITAGILTAEDAKKTNVCLSGEEFRKIVGGIKKDPTGKGKLERKKDF